MLQGLRDLLSIQTREGGHAAPAAVHAPERKAIVVGGQSGDVTVVDLQDLNIQVTQNFDTELVKAVADGREALTSQVAEQIASQAGMTTGPPAARGGGGGVAGDDGETKNEMPFLSAKSITFTSAPVVGAIILNFIEEQAGGSRLLVAAIIAGLFGAFITYLGVTDGRRRTTRSKVQQIGIGIINTVLLWIIIFGGTKLDPF